MKSRKGSSEQSKRCDGKRREDFNSQLRLTEELVVASLCIVFLQCHEPALVEGSSDMSVPRDASGNLFGTFFGLSFSLHVGVGKHNGFL